MEILQNFVAFSEYMNFTFSMGLYHKWNVKNGFAYVLQFFSLISDCVSRWCELGSHKAQSLLILRSL